MASTVFNCDDFFIDFNSIFNFHLLKANEPFEKDCAADYDDIVVNDFNQTQTVPSTSKIPEKAILSEQVKESVRTRFYRARSGRQVKPPSKLTL